MARTRAPSPLVDPRAIAVDSRGTLYICERGGHALGWSTRREDPHRGGQRGGGLLGDGARPARPASADPRHFGRWPRRRPHLRHRESLIRRTPRGRTIRAWRTGEKGPRHRGPPEACQLDARRSGGAARHRSDLRFRQREPPGDPHRKVGLRTMNLSPARAFSAGLVPSCCPEPSPTAPRPLTRPRPPATPASRGSRGQVRSLHPLGALRDPRREWKGGGGQADSRNRRVDHEPREDSCRGVRAAREAVEPREVRPRGLGAAREGRGHEVHRDHLQAPRRLRPLRLQGEPLDVVDATPFKRDILKELAAAARSTACPSASTTRRPRTGTSRRAGNDWDFGPDLGPDGKERKPYDQYLRDKRSRKVRELLTGYGPVALRLVRHSAMMTPERAQRFTDIVRSLSRRPSSTAASAPPETTSARATT